MLNQNEEAEILEENELSPKPQPTSAETHKKEKERRTQARVVKRV